MKEVVLRLRDFVKMIGLKFRFLGREGIRRGK